LHPQIFVLTFLYLPTQELHHYLDLRLPHSLLLAILHLKFALHSANISLHLKSVLSQVPLFLTKLPALMLHLLVLLALQFLPRLALFFSSVLIAPLLPPLASTQLILPVLLSHQLILSLKVLHRSTVCLSPVPELLIEVRPPPPPRCQTEFPSNDQHSFS